VQVRPTRRPRCRADAAGCGVTAYRDGEFVAHLAAQCPWLRKFEMMRVARRALADQAWMRSDKDEMALLRLPDSLVKGNTV